MTDLKTLLNQEVKRLSDNQVGVITDVSDVDIDAKDVIITVKFKDSTKMYSFIKALSTGTIEFTRLTSEKESLDVRNYINNEVNKAINIEKEKTSMMLELHKQDRIREELNKKGNKREKAFIKAVTTKPEQDPDFIDWLKENTQSIRASIPDYLENAFDRYFGKESPRTVVNTKIKTPSGLDRKFSFSFTLHISKDTVIPNQYKHYFKETNCMNNTSFISDLIMSHGFNFGSKLDK